MKIFKRVLGVIVVIALVCGGVLVLGQLFRPTTNDLAFQEQDVFHSLPDNSLDVIVYGSSHAWRDVNVMTMYDEYGIGAFNYGTFWQKLNTTFLYFKDSLRTQTPKVVLIETAYVNTLLQDTDVTGEIFYTRGLGDSEERREYLNQCFTGSGIKKTIERYATYYIPFIQNHSEWANLTKESFSNDMLGENLFATMGYHNVEAYHGTKKYTAKIKDYTKIKQKDISEDALKILDEMVRICKEKDIKLIFFTSPYVGQYRYFDALEKYAEENDVAYINIFAKMDEIGMDVTTDFYDSGHLNDAGAKKEARYLAKFIKENYEVQDMRLVENNLWEQAKNCNN